MAKITKEGKKEMKRIKAPTMAGITDSNQTQLTIQFIFKPSANDNSNGVAWD
jgi:hypothetical protein